MVGATSAEVELYLDEVERAGGTAPRSLAFAASAGSSLRELRMPISGSVIRSSEGEALHPLCVREASSDFQGVVGLPPLLWQGDLPGLPASGALFVRDFGPERNARLIARFPDREPLLLESREGAIRLLGYQEGIGLLWSAEGTRAGG